MNKQPSDIPSMGTYVSMSASYVLIAIKMGRRELFLKTDCLTESERLSLGSRAACQRAIAIDPEQRKPANLVAR
jgi:hypothetical protein